MIAAVIVLVLVVIAIAAAVAWINRRETAGDGFWAEVETGIEGSLSVELPYMAAGSYYQAVRPPAIRTGPLYPADLPGLGRSAAAPGFSTQAGEPGPGSGGSARSSSAAGKSTYQVLYAMATAMNDAWLDRLFAGTGAHRA